MNYRRNNFTETKTNHGVLKTNWRREGTSACIRSSVKTMCVRLNRILKAYLSRAASSFDPFSSSTILHHVRPHCLPKTHAVAGHLLLLLCKYGVQQLPWSLLYLHLPLQDWYSKIRRHHRPRKIRPADIRRRAGGCAARLPRVAREWWGERLMYCATILGVKILSTHGDTTIALGWPLLCVKGRGNFRRLCVRQLDDGQLLPYRHYGARPEVVIDRCHSGRQFQARLTWSVYCRRRRRGGHKGQKNHLPLRPLCGDLPVAQPGACWGVELLAQRHCQNWSHSELLSHYWLDLGCTHKE